MPRLGPIWGVLVLSLFASGCSALPDSITIDFGNRNQNVDAIVQATLQAMTATAAANAAVPTPGTAGGSISGTLNYPAETLPAMYVTAFQVGTQNYKYVLTMEGQDGYQIDGLAPGDYQVVAYTIGSPSFPAGLSGGYTQAVACGLSESCSDHTLIRVSVSAGQSVTGINPADWYLVDGAFPPFPGNAGLPETSPASGADTTGTITGSITYPASGIPALRVVAFQVGGGSYYFVDTSLGQNSYMIENLPPGTYHVVAYVRPGGGFNSGPAGGYTQMVPCGLKFSCDDHALIDVLVAPGGVSAEVDPTDFYADPGAFPPNPAP